MVSFLIGGCSLRSSPSDHGDAKGTAISREALSHIGVRYVYGGSSPGQGFDCSGLVCWAYGRSGVNMPRTAREQSKVGDKIGKGNLRPGDVVVFRVKSGLHTGIYTGQNKFVHSPGRGKVVRIDDMSSDYWKNRFLAGRRHTLLH